MKFHTLAFILLSLTSSCVQSSASQVAEATSTLPVPTILPTATDLPPTTIPTPSLTPAPQHTIRVMTYNILVGAGACGERLNRLGTPIPDTFARVMDVIRFGKPDILAIQEACGWGEGSPSIARQVAQELGMNYAMSTAKGGMPVALFTKFEITKSTDLSKSMTDHGALQVQLVTPDGKQFHVFVVHLVSVGIQENRIVELKALMPIVSQYTESPTIFMGDFNFSPMGCSTDFTFCKAEELLLEAGLVNPNVTRSIDQIWISSSLQDQVSKVDFPDELLKDTSDHAPLEVIISIDALY